jgi:hypothetical protein
MGYVYLGVFIFFVIACFSAFMAGLRHGRKLAEADYAEEQAIKAENEKDYQRAKQEIKQEAFKDAEQRKSELSGHANSIDRFNDINSKLSNRSKD